MARATLSISQIISMGTTKSFFFTQHPPKKIKKEILFFNSASRKTMKVGSYVSSVSYIKDINSFPMNLEIRTIKTYQESGGDNNFTLELNTSLVLLPKKPMRKRFADSRVGYFTERYLDYGSNPQGVKTVSYIKRWRLEPKPED